MGPSGASGMMLHYCKSERVLPRWKPPRVVSSAEADFGWRVHPQITI
jgi:hypothetical protein